MLHLKQRPTNIDFGQGIVMPSGEKKLNPLVFTLHNKRFREVMLSLKV